LSIRIAAQPRPSHVRTVDQDQGLEPPLCAQYRESSADSEIKIPKINHSRIATTYAIVAVVVLDPEHEGPQQISQQGLFHPVASAV